MSKIALVTGASSGIGKETAKVLKNAGYCVYGVARRLEKMKDLKELGINIIEMDVTDDASMVTGVSQIIQQQGRIDILVNCAGYGFYGTIEDVPIKDAKNEMDVNLFSIARLTQLVLPYMRERHFGKIVNISSIAGKMATPLGGWYHASKFAVEGLSDSLRQEVHPFGIDVIIIEPGIIKTNWWAIAKENMLKVSANSVYKGLITKGLKLLTPDEHASDPVVIAELILKAIQEEKPETRYAAGENATFILTARKLLSDHWFDKAVKKQMEL
ncbi:MAG: SDR family NAD(P)-dependent oxidoreductase [Candidatus Azobacteroides sp.]|nr:SDR family NAD(P)-dependent oxidoreductase [Candidatus Azobacteroides sp.]